MGYGPRQELGLQPLVPFEPARGQHHAAAGLHQKVLAPSLRPQADDPSVLSHQLPGPRLQENLDAPVEAPL